MCQKFVSWSLYDRIMTLLHSWHWQFSDLFMASDTFLMHLQICSDTFLTEFDIWQNTDRYLTHFWLFSDSILKLTVFWQFSDRFLTDFWNLRDLHCLRVPEFFHIWKMIEREKISLTFISFPMPTKPHVSTRLDVAEQHGNAIHYDKGWVMWSSKEE